MPWTAADASKHTKRAKTAKQQQQWAAVANDALERCRREGGSDCEASAIRQANAAVARLAAHELRVYFLRTARYEIRRQDHGGRAHLIVPVTMLVEGVHRGSRGPLLHTVAELERAAPAWNGVPVVIHHPQNDEGEYISANSPELESTYVGRVFGVRVQDGRLRADVWLDELKLQEISPETLADVLYSRPVEVSVGMFSDEEEIAGEWHDEHYEGISRNHRPDHLALLPDGVGACSIADGCGIRVNEQFEPPESGDAPAGVKSILRRVYNDCRARWVKDHPNDRENAANKTSCSKIAWDAVKRAGWKKQNEKWINVHEKKGGNDMGDDLVVDDLVIDDAVEGNAAVSGMETKRKQLGMSVSDFYAVPRDPPSDSKLPIFDADHVRNAMARFSQTQGLSAGERATAKRKIIARAKKFNIDTKNFEGLSAEFEGMWSTMKDLNADGYVVHLISNETGFREMFENVHNKLNAMDNDMRVHFLQEMYNDYIVYEVRRRDREGVSSLYKQSYQVNDGGEIEFTGDPVEVRRKVEYVAMASEAQKFVRTKFNSNKGGSTMTGKKPEGDASVPCCEDLVNALIKSDRTKFEEGDKGWLLTLEEAQLSKLLPEQEKPEDKPTSAPQISAQPDKVPTMQEYMSKAPVELREQLRYGQALLDAKRNELIQSILANAAEKVWTEEELKKMDFEMLERLSRSIKKQVSYSLQGVPSSLTANVGEEHMLPTGVKLKEKSA